MKHRFSGKEAVNIPNCPLNINLLNSVDVFPRRGAKQDNKQKKLYKISFPCFHLFFHNFTVFLRMLFTLFCFLFGGSKRLILIKLLITCFCFFVPAWRNCVQNIIISQIGDVVEKNGERKINFAVSKEPALRGLV